MCRWQGSWRGSEALWIVMEYCGGGSVADLMHASDVPLDQDMISYICAETLAGLAYLHSIGKVHHTSAAPRYSTLQQTACASCNCTTSVFVCLCL